MSIKKETLMTGSKSALRLIMALGLASLALLSFGCKSLTKPRVANLKGRVVLENDCGDPAFDNADLSGIKVSLYKPVALDSTIVRLQANHPILGPVIDQSMVFDPQKEIPIKSTTTNAEGRYELKGIAIDQYHLVFEKDGWGRVVEYYVNAGKSSEQDGNEFSSKDLRTTAMYPIVQLPSMVNEEFTFKNSHTYVVDGTANFMAPVHFAGHCRVELAPNSDISFFEDIIYDDVSPNYVTFTSLDNGPEGKAPRRWGMVRIHKDDQTIKNWTVENSVSGIFVEGNHSVVRSCLVRDSDAGIHVQAEYSEIDKIIFAGISSRAVYYNQVPPSDVIKQRLVNCIFKSCQEGLRTQGQGVEVANNYFIDNVYALFSFAGHHIIRNNAFDRNKDAIIINGSRICIEYNTFHHNTNSVHISGAYYDGVPDPQFVNNNFYQTSDLAFRIATQGLRKDIDAKNNYWFASDIDSIIYDAVDAPSLIYKIIYLPKKTKVIETAGIVNNP
jgi:hypothetical protein